MRSLDFALFNWINATPATPHALISIATLITHGLPALTVVVLALAAVLNPAWRRPVLLVALSMVLTWAGATLVRWGMPMPRPGQLGMGHQWIEHALSPGFPSMHASCMFAAAMALVWGRCWPLALPSLVAAVLVAWSRPFLGVHFPMDVAGGFVLGSVVSWIVCWGARHIGVAQRRG
ncbi:MAG: phosphatase PAP2 family protein [Burkholderiaceae bacterium]|jgi:undecaprenyl-diphosphatase|nr:phosphatase PAP2 family protein [Burkholderiaceae bacterium]